MACDDGSENCPCRVGRDSREAKRLILDILADHPEIDPHELVDDLEADENGD